MKILGRIIGVLVAILTLLFIGAVTYLNVVPMRYYIPLVLSILTIIFFIVYFLCRKKTNIIVRVLLIILSLGFGFIFCIGIHYVYTTIRFMNKVNAIKEEITTYYVLVRNDSKYQKVEDIKDKKIVIYKEPDEAQKKALKSLEEKVSFKHFSSMDLRKMGIDLLNKEEEVLFVGDSYKEIMDEEIPDFKENIRILDTISVKTKVKEIMKEVNTSKESFSIYISGIDTYGNISTRSRSDVNIVMTVNPSTHDILLTSIPRDYYVRLRGTTGARDKLTHAGIYGINMSVGTLEDLLGTTMNYYIRVNFDTLIKVVDVIGGIDVYVDQTIRPVAGKGYILSQGMNHMDGATALAFSRERKSYQEGDRHRGKNQQDVIAAIIKKVGGSKTLLTQYTDILNSLDGSFQTNIDTNQMTSFIKMQLETMKEWNILTYNLNGYDSSNITYSMGNMRLYVMEPDTSTVEMASRYINGMKEGKSLKELGLS